MLCLFLSQSVTSESVAHFHAIFGYHTMVVEQIVILTRLSEREAHTFEAVNKVKVKNE